MGISNKVNHHWTRLSFLNSKGNMTNCDKALMMLNIGIDILDMDLGIISHIVGNTYHIQNSTHKEYVNQQWKLSETYCDLTIHHNGIVDLAYMTTAFKLHPAYQHLQIESYIGIPFTVRGQVYGTIAYIKSEPRRNDFTSDELHFMTQLSNIVSKAFEASAVS